MRAEFEASDGVYGYWRVAAALGRKGVSACQDMVRAEMADAASAIAADVAAGRLKAASINEKTIQRYLYAPTMRDVDLFIRTGGEQRTSNFLMWSSAYAELYFSELPWPEFDRTELWRACQAYAHRDRRFGGAVDAVAGQ